MEHAIVSMVLERLALEFGKMVGDEVYLVLYSKEEAKNLVSNLKEIQKRLGAAEKRGVTEPNVFVWLENQKIKDKAYEVEDALDEWEMKEFELKKIKRSQEVSKFCEKVSSSIQILNLTIQRHCITRKVKKLNERLELITKLNDEKFKPYQNQKIKLDRTTTSYVDLSKVKVSDDIKKELVSKLLSEGSQQASGIRIIAIVGTGGLGKTTLAQLAFNDSEVDKHFPSKTWVCVSGPFDGIRIAQAILESLNRGSSSSTNVTQFQTYLELIESFISGSRERFLLVLDDVWTDPTEGVDTPWAPLKVCLDNGKAGSRILVTTRKKRVADMMGAQIQRLQPLSDLDCWSLMSQIAFRGGEERHQERLETIGPEISKKCAGLPLAAKALGTHLNEIGDEPGWMEVQNNEVWTLDNARDKIFHPIYLSYQELQPAVKRCFTYCAIYPKDLEIKADKLIKMWMAQGFLSSDSTKMEHIGRRCLNDLVACSLLQVVKEDDLTGQIESCKMHDIIHDFAQYVTNGECVTVTAENFVDKGVSRSIARHLALRHRSALRDLFSTFGVENLKKLRSFIMDPDRSFIIDPDLFQWGTLKCVRVLNLSQCGLKEVPLEIAKLFQLRYLDLSRNHRIREFPTLLCHLYNLQTLFLDGCLGLSKLPEEICKLINLRHLSLDDLCDAFSLPQEVEKLTCLRTLTCFKAERGGSKLGYLKNLNQLEGFLKIMIGNLNEESDAIEAQKAELKNKTRLVSVEMAFRGEVSMKVKEALEPPSNLTCLILSGFGVEFPRWISTSLKLLKVLKLSHCGSLPPLGNLQSLESLSISNVGHEYLRITDGGEAAFPKLKVLEFDRCDDWTEWEDIREEENVVSIMPELRTLSVQKCPKLKSLPQRLLGKMSLEHLDIDRSYN